MKILLRDTQTGLYLSRGGGWSDDPAGALAFLDEVRAKDYGIYHRLSSASVVVMADTSAPEIRQAPPPDPAPANPNTEIPIL